MQYNNGAGNEYTGKNTKIKIKNCYWYTFHFISFHSLHRPKPFPILFLFISPCFQFFSFLVATHIMSQRGGRSTHPSSTQTASAPPSSSAPAYLPPANVATIPHAIIQQHRMGIYIISMHTHHPQSFIFCIDNFMLLCVLMVLH
jgi:hypothetical protein